MITEMGRAVDPELSERAGADEALRLTPRRGGGAALTVAFSAFPGVFVRYGDWHIQAYPSCGCDACDEDPAELVEQFRSCAEALAIGKFAEELKKGFRPSLIHEFEPGNPGWMRLTRARARQLGPPQRRQWEAWPSR